MNRLTLQLIPLIALASVASCGAPVELRQQVDAHLADETARPFNGVVMIAEGTRVVYDAASGLADRERAIPLRVSSRFLIGSLTKQMTATVLLREVDAGRVDLEAPIATYLDLAADWAARVKVRHLLNHTSGIAALDAPLKAEPGSIFSYSNLGYQLIGEIIEKASAERFAVMTERLFESCGMRESSMLQPDGAEGLVSGYAEQSDQTLAIAPQAERAKHLPSGGAVSTAADLVRWNQCLHHGKLLSAASYTMMVTPSTKRPHRWGDLGYGFGLQISEKGRILEFSHSGYVTGFISTMAYYPKTDRTFVAIENISWDAENVERVFAPHDAVLDVVRSTLDDPWLETVGELSISPH